MAQKITRDQLSKDTFSGAVDANGWEVELKANGKKVFRKSGVSYVQLDASTHKEQVLSSNIPVGYTSIDQFYVSGYIGHNGSTAISASIRCDNGATQVKGNFQNRAAAWQGGDCKWSFELNEK